MKFDKKTIDSVVKALRGGIVKYSPQILTGVGISGLIGAGIWAVKVTPAAYKQIHVDSRENHDGDPNAYTKMEAVKSTWKSYAPPIVLAMTSSVCLICANRTSTKRSAALAAAYKVSEMALSEYKEQANKGRKPQEVIDEMAEQRVKEHPVDSSLIIDNTGGKTLCLDSLSGQYFMSDVDKIKRAEARINEMMVRETIVSLNDLYDELGLNRSKIGDELGWDINDIGRIEMTFSSQLASNNEPCLVVDYYKYPKPIYS